MGTAKTIARRTFLIGTAAVAGGLVVGWVAYKWPIKNPLLEDLDEGEQTLNPYVRIDANGITIITPRMDMGQGAYSVQAAMVAEELDVEWGMFRVDPGPPSKAYYNQRLMDEAFPIPATDEGFLARRAHAFGEVVTKLVGLQITGGSTTVADGYEKLRMAGAVARQLLLKAAAKQTGVALGDLRTEKGAVITPDGTRIAYTALAAAAAQQRAPSNVALKDPKEWRLLGKPMQRLDVVAKSTGTATYGIDIRLPNMVYATVRANPRVGGVMQSVDDSEAKAAKGVIKVVPVRNGVAVIADNTWRAFRAASLLKPFWGPSPYPETSEKLWTLAESSFTEERRDSRFKDEGDVDAVLTGPETLSAEYRVPFLAHAPLEPMTAVAHLHDGTLEMWMATQVPIFAQQEAAKVAGLTQEQVTIHVQIAGGSFGRRLENDFVIQAAELAVAHPGVPVKLTWTREEDLTHDFPRPFAIARARGLAKDGKVEAYALDIAAPSVLASQGGRLGQSIPGPDGAIVAGAWDQPWAIPHYRVTGYRVPETVPVSSWRSVGASANGFLHECFLDELILAAGADPLAERLRLCTHEPSRRVLEAVGELSKWKTPLEPGRGRGLAYTLSFGTPVAEVVEVTDTPEGIRIDKVFVACEVGRVLDPTNFENQVQGAVMWGLSHAAMSELTYVDGAAQQTNFHLYENLRFSQAPVIEVMALQTTERVGGIGEPPVPPAAPALANAIFAATGKRIRQLPLKGAVKFA